MNIKFGEFCKKSAFVKIVNGHNFLEFAKTGKGTGCTLVPWSIKNLTAFGVVANKSATLDSKAAKISFRVA
jgi:hypothetical protein